VNRLACFVLGGVVAVSARPALAQPAAPTRTDVESRYQIGQMERVLVGAVEHGVTILRDRMQDVTQLPMDLMVSDNAHARGFRIDGYGVFFDVIAPSFETSALLLNTYNTLNQNDLGVEDATKKLQIAVKGDKDSEQALQRLLILIRPQYAGLNAPSTRGARNQTGSAAVDTAQQPDPIFTDPNEVYRTEVIGALKAAMLDYSSNLEIGAADWLTIAVKGNDTRPRLAPADTAGRTVILRVRGADLTASHTNQIARTEALQRIEVKTY
jgi:hypothetical protein